MSIINDEIIKDFTTNTKKDFTKEYEDLCWVLASECGWSQEDIMNAEIPFVLGLLSARARAFKEQEKNLKRKK
jgi:hypothetical protein